MFLLCCVLVAFSSVCVAQQQGALPALIPPVTFRGENSETCPSAEDLDRLRNKTNMAIKSLLDETVIPMLSAGQSCPCGGAGEWHRIAHLNTSDPNQQCPPNWRLHTTPVRACGAASGSSRASAVFPSHGESYSRVCGRVIAYQRGAPDAFWVGINQGVGLEGVYLDGVSLTHGTPRSRQHIWSFAAAAREGATGPSICPCTNTDSIWPHQVPSFIGNNYFCETGNPGPGASWSQVFADDPLWDGEGCGPTSSCCQLNTPPWFCTTLPQHTTDDIELRICNDEGLHNEDTLVSLVDVYIM